MIMNECFGPCSPVLRPAFTASEYEFCPNPSGNGPMFWVNAKDVHRPHYGKANSSLHITGVAGEYAIIKLVGGTTGPWSWQVSTPGGISVQDLTAILNFLMRQSTSLDCSPVYLSPPALETDNPDTLLCNAVLCS